MLYYYLFLPFHSVWIYCTYNFSGNHGPRRGKKEECWRQGAWLFLLIKEAFMECLLTFWISITLLKILPYNCYLVENIAPLFLYL